MGQGHVHTAAGVNKKRLVIVFGLTSLYLLAEVVGGLMTHSMALLADAGHMLTDVAGLGLALFAIRFAERPATPERTYGCYRVEILAALTNAVVLIGISLFILYEAWERFQNPPEVESEPMVIIVDDRLHDEILSTVHEQITTNFKFAHVTVQIENAGWRDCEAHL